jgi:glycosyltransferase involved in cell wall biosynthesis
VAEPLVVVDADVLGRHRTGDETYVERLLHALPGVAGGLRLAALTRRPDLVPAGVEPIEIRSRVQELRMAVRVPLVLRRARPALVHFVHALPPFLPCPAVLTIQDLSFERDASLMGRRETTIFKTVVPRSVRRAERVFAISQRTKDDLVELYHVEPERVVVTELAYDDSLFRPEPDGMHDDFLLLVGAIERRKDPLVAAAAAEELGLRLVSVGPVRDEALAGELRRRGADMRGFVDKDELARLYRRAACLLFPTRYEGFGLPVVEAMASGTPVVATRDAAVQEAGGYAVVYAEPDGFADAVRRALADRERWREAGLARARAFSWEETARKTVEVYRQVLGS